MIDAGELRKGTAIELDGEIYQIVEYQHVKMQQRQPVIRLRLRNIRSGNTLERNFQPSDKFTAAFLEHRPIQYLYNDANLYYFMDSQTYEQIALTSEQLGEAVDYLKEGLNLEIMTHRGEAVNVELPTFVELQVVETEPGFKGDTATAGNKPAKLETGLTAQVPLFINVGDTLKIDTRSGKYLEKAS
jgi:elongation factor P